MRISTAIFAMIAVAILAFGFGVNSGWKTGVQDGQNLEVCNVSR